MRLWSRSKRPWLELADIADQEIVAGIFGYSERFDADIGAQLFSRPLLGVLQRPVRDHPQLLGGSPQADREDRQNRSENRDYQRSPSVGARGNARSEVESLRRPGVDFVVAQTMICSARVLADRNRKP